jgi:hypothetical protein
MKAGNIFRRLAALEGISVQDMVTVTHQWLNEDGTPAGELIERRVPRSRIQSLEKMFEERDEHERQHREET